VISREISRYDPTDAASVSHWIRTRAGSDAAIDELISIYREVIEEYKCLSVNGVRTELDAAAAYLSELRPTLQRAEIQKAELEMIRNSRGWRWISRYAAIKQKLRRSAHNPNGKAIERLDTEEN
jgi:hypothetical protein